MKAETRLEPRETVNMKKLAHALGMSLPSVYRWLPTFRARLRLLLATQPAEAGVELGQALADAEDLRTRQIETFEDLLLQLNL